MSIPFLVALGAAAVLFAVLLGMTIYVDKQNQRWRERVTGNPELLARIQQDQARIGDLQVEFERQLAAWRREDKARIKELELEAQVRMRHHPKGMT